MELKNTEEGITLDPSQNQEQKQPEQTEQKGEESSSQQAQPEDKVVQPPKKFEGESDIQHNLRVQLFNINQARKDPSVSEEEQSLLTAEIKRIRQAMAESHKSPGSTDPTPAKVFSTEEEEKAVIENLKKLGFYTKDDLNTVASELEMRLKSESRAAEQAEAINSFYTIRPDIATDKVKRAQVEQYVLENFKITPTSSKKELQLALDMTANYLYPRGQSSKAKESESKVDLVNISGSSSSPSKKSVSDSTYKTLKESGWTDEQIERFGLQ